MPAQPPATGDTVVVQRRDLPELFRALAELGYVIVGPTVRDTAIVYDDIHGVEELPIGWTDAQEAGSYRLERRGDEAVFGFNLGPNSWKRYLLVPALRLWRARRSETGFVIDDVSAAEAPRAFVGVRACELHAIAIQDHVLLEGPHRDPDYDAHRRRVLTIAVNCTQAAPTCFCASMGTGPRVTRHFDLAITELLEREHHEFVVDIGSSAGARVMRRVSNEPGDARRQEAAARAVDEAARQMRRHLPPDAIRALLYGNLEHPRWDDVAARCLGCANCTMVCPTCFCTTVEDSTDLTGKEAERVRRWDSCFTLDFSHVHGGSVRRSLRARYRHWLTHKLGSWLDQFGTSGCVGCGRCITWCPVGIDITEEVAAIRGAPPAARSPA